MVTENGIQVKSLNLERFEIIYLHNDFISYQNMIKILVQVL
jgi:hypothetical protein